MLPKCYKINSYMRLGVVDLPVGPLASFILFVMRGSSLQFPSLVSWLARRFRPALSSKINKNLFEELSSIIALKDRGFFWL
jgi:hypothetical protein